MNIDDSRDDERAIPSGMERIDELCDLFERAIQDGETPEIDEYIKNFPESERATAFRELFHIELAYEKIRNEDAPATGLYDRYALKFPQYLDVVEEVFFGTETHELMHSRPKRRSGSAGLHVRCPHCHNPIEFVADAPLSEVECPSCGSHFSLLNEEADTQSAPPVTHVAHFELIQRLGMGAFGTVWKSRDTTLDRTVAVKIPRKGQLTDEDSEKFIREARAAAQLQHPNIVSVHEVGRYHDSLYIVSDFVRGVPLSEKLTDQRISVREASQLTKKLALAIHHAHTAGVIHRDLKPHNVMIDADGEPHLMDFGLAKREAGEITMTLDGQVFGTPAYMSPEQARGEGHKVDRRSDIYSLGVMLFQLLTGELPFRGTTRMLLHKVINDDPPSPRRLDANTPRDLETICLKAMEKEPGRRYSTAEELAHDLERYLSGRPVSARPISSWERCRRWVRRHPAVAGLLAVSVLALISLVGVLLSYGYQIRLQDVNKELEVTNEALRMSSNRLELANSELNSKQDQLAAANQALNTANNRLERLSSIRQIKLAHRALQDGRPIECARLLSKCPIEHRYWEWRFVSSLCFPVATYTHFNWNETSNYPAHCDIVFRSNGLRVASALPGGGLRVWDASSGRDIFALEGRRSSRVALSPDGNRVASVNEQNLRIWNVSDARLVLSLSKPLRDGRVVFSSDGTRIAAGGRNGLITIWNASTGEELFTVDGKDSVKHGQINRDASGRETHVASVRTLAFSPDGSRIAIECTSLGRGWTSVWDSSTGKAMFSMRGEHVTFSHDSTRMATSVANKKYGGGGPEFSTIRMWDTTKGKELAEFSHSGPIHNLVFSPDDKFLAIASEDVSLWNAATGERAFSLVPGNRIDASTSPAVMRLTFNESGGRLAGANRSGTKVFLWDTSTSRESVNIEVNWRRAALNRDGSRITTIDERGVSVWDTASGMEISRLPRAEFGNGRHIYLVGFGDRIAGVSDRTLKIWEASTGKELRALPLGPLVERPRYAGAWSLNGGRVARTVSNGTLKVWDVPSGNELLSLADFRGLIEFSPDGQRLAVLRGRPRGPNEDNLGFSTNGKLEVWDVTDGKRLFVVNVPQNASDIAFSQKYLAVAVGTGYDTILNDGDQNTRYVAHVASNQLSTKDRIILYDAISGEIANTLDLIRVRPVLSRNGDWLAAINDDMLSDVGTVWNTSTLQPTAELGGNIMDMVFSSDGKRIVSADGFGAVRMWATESGEETFTLAEGGGQHRSMSLEASEDGNVIAAFSSDGEVRIWNAKPSRAMDTGDDL